MRWCVIWAALVNELTETRAMLAVDAYKHLVSCFAAVVREVDGELVIDGPWTQQHLADLAGCATKRSATIIMESKRGGFVKCERHRIVLLRSLPRTFYSILAKCGARAAAMNHAREYARYWASQLLSECIAPRIKVFKTACSLPAQAVSIFQDAPDGADGCLRKHRPGGRCCASRRWRWRSSIRASRRATQRSSASQAEGNSTAHAEHGYRGFSPSAESAPSLRSSRCTAGRSSASPEVTPA